MSLEELRAAAPDRIRPCYDGGRHRYYWRDRLPRGPLDPPYGRWCSRCGAWQHELHAERRAALDKLG